MTNHDKPTVTGLKAIWDDSDSTNTGWYFWFRDSNGETYTSQVAGKIRKDAGLRRLGPEARTEARSFGLHVPRGLEVEIADAN